MTQSATGAYIANVTSIISRLNALKAAADDQFGTNPDQINWGDVGTVQKVDSMLAEIMEFSNVKVQK